MKLKGQVGFWGSTGGLTLGVSEELREWVGSHDTDFRVFVSVTTDRKVIVLPDRCGGKICTVGLPLAVSPYRYTNLTVPDSLFMDIELPCFELMAVDFIVEEGCVVASLPADHNLPWPKLQVNSPSYDAAQLAEDALQTRLNSLFASGLTNFQNNDQRMPQRLYGLLPQGRYMECVRTAKILAGVN